MKTLYITKKYSTVIISIILFLHSEMCVGFFVDLFSISFLNILEWIKIVTIKNYACFW